MLPGRTARSGRVTVGACRWLTSPPYWVRGRAGQSTTLGWRTVKKALLATIATLLIALGWSPAAQAGPNDGYPGVVQPDAGAQGPHKAKAGETIKVRAKIDLASNGQPCRGKFMLKVTPKGATSDARLFKMFKDTNGGDKTFSFAIDEPGKYIVKLRFIPEYRSPCKGAHD